MPLFCPEPKAQSPKPAILAPRPILIPLNRPIEIMNAVPKGKISRLPIRVILAFGRKTANHIGLHGESGMQNAELHLAAKKISLAG